MNLLKSDLRELDLNGSQLLETFWKLESNVEGTKKLSREIKEEYFSLLQSCTPEQVQKLRHLVSKIVVLAGVRGLQWADALWRRDSREKGDGNEWCLLKHPSIQDLLRKTPPASTQEICKALDRRGEPMPWKMLPPQSQNRMPDDRLWESNRNHQYVKSLITRAKNKLSQMDEDRKYVKLLHKNRRQFSTDVAAAKENTVENSAPKSRLLPGIE